jgi:hypothetical protein
MLTSSSLLLGRREGRLVSNLGPPPIKGGIFGAVIPATAAAAIPPLAMATGIALIPVASVVFDRVTYTVSLLVFFADRCGR